MDIERGEVRQVRRNLAFGGRAGRSLALGGRVRRSLALGGRARRSLALSPRARQTVLQPSGEVELADGHWARQNQTPVVWARSAVVLLFVREFLMFDGF